MAQTPHTDKGSADTGTGTGTAAAPDPQVTVDVDNTLCHLFGICQQEAATVFDLGPDGRLRYDPHPPAAATAAVRQAARCCPMQAITLRPVNR